MNAKNLIESGVIELYCLGIASDEEVKVVEALAAKDQMVRDEIIAVRETLVNYALASTKLAPPKNLKEKIISTIMTAEADDGQADLPPELTPQSTAEEWFAYLEEHHIGPDDDNEPLVVRELNGTEDYYTYAVFGKPGAEVPEELHTGHNEYLLICQGSCIMDIDGKKSHYRKGDFLTITHGIRHSAVVTGDEPIVVIGQRRAAA